MSPRSLVNSHPNERIYSWNSGLFIQFGHPCKDCPNTKLSTPSRSILASCDHHINSQLSQHITRHHIQVGLCKSVWLLFRACELHPQSTLVSLMFPLYLTIPYPLANLLVICQFYALSMFRKTYKLSYSSKAASQLKDIIMIASTFKLQKLANQGARPTRIEIFYPITLELFSIRHFGLARGFKMLLFAL